ncbi:outer membrane beta-barrel protein [Microbulbifer sp. JTAC008]|uniref:outer membrane beta-barrel protein n=1 Tax=unclassified Microbulbifer TaxID=2619833 RepID=UPI00403A0D7C
MRRITPLSLSILALASGANTYASEKPFYAKATLGYMSFDTRARYTESEDLNSTGYSFTLGYRINNYLAVEGGMVDLGEIRQEYKGDGEFYYSDYYQGQDVNVVDSYTYDSNIKTDYKSYSLGLALTQKFQQNFNAIVRLGVHQWCANKSGQRQITGTRSYYENGGIYDVYMTSEPYEISYNPDSATDGSDLYYGAEISWSTGTWDIGLEHTIYEVEDEKADFTALGVTYNF